MPSVNKLIKKYFPKKAESRESNLTHFGFVNPLEAWIGLTESDRYNAVLSPRQFYNLPKTYIEVKKGPNDEFQEYVALEKPGQIGIRNQMKSLAGEDLSARIMWKEEDISQLVGHLKEWLFSDYELMRTAVRSEDEIRVRQILKEPKTFTRFSLDEKYQTPVVYIDETYAILCFASWWHLSH